MPYAPSRLEVLEGHYTVPGEPWKGMPCYSPTVCKDLEVEGLLTKITIPEWNNHQAWRITEKGIRTLKELQEGETP